MLRDYMQMALISTNYTKDTCCIAVLDHNIKNGPACLKRFTYMFGDIVVSFGVWYIENYSAELYKKHNLPTNLHKTLYGSLDTYSKKLGSFSFSGNDGQQIVDKILKKSYSSPQIQINKQKQR